MIIVAESGKGAGGLNGAFYLLLIFKVLSSFMRKAYFDLRNRTSNYVV